MCDINLHKESCLKHTSFKDVHREIVAHIQEASSLMLSSIFVVDEELGNAYTMLAQASKFLNFGLSS